MKIAFRRWLKATYLTLALLIFSICSVIPFLEGHRWHDFWNLGKILIVTSGTLFVGLLWVAGMTYSIWLYVSEPISTRKRRRP
ncbi:hypothetical protein [Tunturibacter empetritectus]|uniref:Uncharacterized protein n=1 Tax=Tunturiibacter lichenicola TaxID=2051959 RepID=A0A7W8J5B4_9BACT|nr:hypothetical protein [Edaphobacter lichenicola]MBB5342924.1 hypothetical protein [Edaphobacter lichenicola]